MSRDDQLAEALKSWLAGQRGLQSGQHWGSGRIDRVPPSGQASRSDPRDPLRGWAFGYVSEEDIRLANEFSALMALGLHQWPRLKRKHKFMATIAGGYRLGGFNPGFSERLELGVTLKETSSRWTNFAGRRCLLEPGEHSGREIEIAWRESD